MSIIKYQDKNGNTLYKFEAYIGRDLLTGKRLRKKGSGYKTKRDAMLAEQRTIENYIPPTIENLTFNDVYLMWREEYKPSVKESTFIRTLQYFDFQILPYFNNMKVKDILVLHAKKFAKEMYDQYSKFKEIVSNAKRVMEYAKANEIITKNPFDSIIYPKSKCVPRTPVVLSKIEIYKQLDCMKEHFNIKWYTYFFLLTFTGLRRGEINALTWDDINLKTGYLRVNKTISLNLEKKEHVSSTPKTEESNRQILMFDFLINQLKEYRKWQLNNKILSITNLVFPADKTNKHISLSRPLRKLNSFYKEYPELRKQTIHDFRHTFASLLLSSKADYKYIQSTLGHRSTVFTLNKYVEKTSDYEIENRDRVCKLL